MTSTSAPWPLAGVLQRLTADPGRPRLTWYGPAGERIELSGHVLDNWVTKTTNLLVEEFSAGPGVEVLLDLPVHWRTVVWAYAAWRCGACVALPDPSAGPGVAPVGSRPALVVTDHPDRWAASMAELAAVALPGLARRFEGPLPRGAMDAAAAVQTYGDVLTWLPEADTRHPALLGPAAVPHGDLLGWAGRTAAASMPAPGPTSDVERVLLEPAPTAEVATVLAQALTVHADDGSVVLCSSDTAAELAVDAPRRARLIQGERITRA